MNPSFEGARVNLFEGFIYMENDPPEYVYTENDTPEQFYTKNDLPE